MIMRISVFPLLAAAALLMSACEKERTINENIEENGVKTMSFTASLESPATKTSLDNKTVRWSANDVISIYDGTGSQTVTNTGGDDNFTFSVDVPSESKTFTAFYPYNGDLYHAETGMIQWYLNPNQTAVQDGFANNLAPMVAYTTSTSLEFKNLAALVSFQLESDDISMVIFEGRNGEKLSGRFKANAQTYAVSFTDLYQDRNDAQHYVNFGKPSDRDYFKSGETYYIVVMPQTLANGFKITLEGAGGKRIEKFGTKPVTLKRNTILNLGTLYESVLDVNESTLYADAAGEVVSFTVTATNGLEWTAVGSTGLTVSPTSGTADGSAQTISVTVPANEDTENGKEYTVTVSAAGANSKTVTIIQPAKGTAPVWPASSSFNHGGVTSGCTISGDTEDEFTVNVPATGYYPFHMYFSLTNVTLSIDPANLPSGVGVDGSLTNGTGWTSGAGCPFWVNENTTESPVVYDIPLTMTATNGAVKTYTMHVVRAANIQFSVASASLNVAASATEATIVLTANVDWTASVTSGSATLSAASGNASANIVVSFAANDDADNSVVYEVTLSSAGLPDIVVTITQASASGGGAPTCDYSFEFSWTALATPYQAFNPNYNEGHWITISNISPAISAGDVMGKLVPFAFEFSALDDADKTASGLSGTNFASEVSVTVLNVLDGGATVQFQIKAGSVSGDAKIVMKNSDDSVYATRYIHVN